MKRVHGNKVFFLLLAVFLLVNGWAQNNPQRGLRLSANKRFFTDEKGAPFFWLGDTGWLLFSKLNREEAATYLEDRRQKGFNGIQAMVLHNVAL